MRVLREESSIACGVFELEASNGAEENGCFERVGVRDPLTWVAGRCGVSNLFSKTWQYIIRERDYVVGLNWLYADVMPDGMPEGVLQ